MTIPQRFDEIYDATRQGVLAFITAKCGRITDVGDIFQETYLELYRLLQRRGTNYIANERALVMRLARQKIFKHYSLIARVRQFMAFSKPPDDDESPDWTDAEADAFLTEEWVISRLLYENAKQLLRAKPQVVQKIFYLMYDVGLPLTEIAQVLSLSESTVKNKLYRTLKDLRSLMKED